MKRSTYLLGLALGASTLTFAQVGIGTSTPSSPLDIQADDAAIDINSEAADGSRDPKINFQLTGTTTFSIGLDDADSDKLKIGVGAPETSTRMTIDGSGNVGIGNTSPTATLDVDGDAIFNESGAAKDFRVEGDTEANPLFIDGSADKIGIGTSSPRSTLTIVGGEISIDSDGDNDWAGIANLDPGLALSGRSSALSNPHVFIDNDGEVGIGTTSPEEELTVNGQILTKTVNYANNQDQAYLIAGTQSYTGATTNWGTYGYQHRFKSDGSGASRVTIDGTSGEIMCWRENGNVGIGTTSPGYILTVNGQPGANGYTAFTNYSDRRLKTNIDSLDAGVLDKILQLNPVSFQYNDKYLQLYPESDLQRVHKGFIAQEIQKVFPEMVSEMKESPDSVKYLDLDISHLQVYLVKALQEQQAIIEAQKKENESQKAEIESLKTEASNSSAETNQKLDANTSEIEALKAQVQQMLQLIQQQESVSIVK